jgi:hypothetical protein
MINAKKASKQGTSFLKKRSKKLLSVWLYGLAISFTSLAALAEPGPESLGTTLTPFGAIRVGNEAGTIPPWDGGTTRTPAGYQAGKPLINPYAGEKPLFTITAANVSRYQNKLAAGVVLKLRTLPGYRLDVYPSHRNFAAPDYIYQAAIANAGRAHLSNNGQDVEGAELSIPFPVPHNGNEAIWNHLLRWRGPQVRRTDTEAVINSDGNYALSRTAAKILFAYNTPGDHSNKINDYVFIELLAPPRNAGGIDITRDFTNPFEQPRQSWVYNPGERRVRRAPKISYDTPIGDTDGLETVDDLDLFNGALDRYNWKLVGRREMYVPYNCYDLQQPTHTYRQILGPTYINPDFIRWELHRVWEVDATLRPGEHHLYSRRTVYIDEDSWQMLISDRYDNRGLLWRTAAGFPVLRYDIPLLAADGYEYNDLISRRYFVVALHGQEPVQPRYDGAKLTPDEFTPEALRDAGRR